MNPIRLSVTSADKTVIPHFVKRTRSRHYVDFVIQLWMLIALIVMEVLLVAAGVTYLYFSFNKILEAGLYRIHHTGHPSSLSQMLIESGMVIITMVVVNLIALIIADRIWVRYVRSILESFLDLGYRTIAFDLRPDDNPAIARRRAHHRVIDLMVAWRDHEFKRATHIRSALDQIPTDADFSHSLTREHILNQLEGIRRLLPPYSRRLVSKNKWDLS